MRAAVGLLSCALGALLGAGLSAAAQPSPPRLVPDCGGTYNLCGFRDRGTKAEVIPRKFERVFLFSEGLAAVRVDGRFGYIDERGEFVIQPRYDLAGSFYQGLAEVLIGDQTGVIDRQGRLVVAPRFARSFAFTKDVLIAREGNWKSNHFQGREQLPNLTELGSFYGGPWGLFHIRNGWLTRPDYQFSAFEKTGRGLIWATTGHSMYGPFGLMRADGTWQVEPQFTHVQTLMDDRAIVAKPGNSPNAARRQTELRGAVDQDGLLVVPLKAWVPGYFANGKALVREWDNENKRGLIDKAGNLIGGRLFDRVERAETGGVSRVMFDGSWHGLDRQGNLLPDPQGGTIIADCPAGLRVVKQSNGIQVVDQQGRPTIPYLLDERRGFPFACDRPTAVKLGSKWGFIGPDGRLLFDPPPFDDLYDFSNGYAIVRRDGLYGLIDTNGRFTLELQFGAMRFAGMVRPPRSQGEVQAFDVNKAGRDYLISAIGQELPASARPDPRPRYLACAFGMKFISRTGLFGFGATWGIADADGRTIVAPRFRALHCFQNGVAWAAVDTVRQWCPVGPDGVVRTEPACVTSRHPITMSHTHPERLADDPYESSVLWSRAYLEYGAGRRAEPPRLFGDFSRDRPEFAMPIPWPERSDTKR